MKKSLVFVIIAVILAVLAVLVACSNSSAAENEFCVIYINFTDNPPIPRASSDLPMIDNTYDISDFTLGGYASKTQSWKEAYAALLRHYYEQYDGEYSLHFLLHDIDMDGIPELFISEQGDWVYHIDVVYTFRDGEVVFLEFGEGVTFMPHLFSVSGPYLTPNFDNAPGVITRFRGVRNRNWGGNYLANLIIIDGDRLVVESRGEWIVDGEALSEMNIERFDRDAVTGESILTIDGEIVTRDELGQIIMEHTTITINGEVVSEGEFYRIFGFDRYGRSGDCPHLRPVRIGIGWRFPLFLDRNDDLLEILVGAGTGIWSSQFFSARRNALSESFESPIWITGELIGQLSRSDSNEMILVIRNIFDKEAYYSSFTLVNFSNVANPISGLVYMEYLGYGKLEITYLAGENFYHKNVTIQLPYIHNDHGFR